MALGGPASWLLEVQWDGVTYSDESAYLKAGTVVAVTRGRGSEADDIQVGTLTGVLDNALTSATIGRFTADNPLSPIDVADGARCRFTVTRGVTSSVRHRGKVAVSTPELPDGDVAYAEVTFESVDALADAAGRPLRCNQVEFGLAASLLDEWDVFPFEPGLIPTVLPNLGSGGGTATLIRPLSGVGSAELVQPEGVQVDGAISLKAKDGVGPVVYIRSGVPAGAVNDVIIPFRTGDRVAASGAPKYVALGRNASGDQLWSLRLYDNIGTPGRSDLILVDGAGTEVRTVYPDWASIGDATGDDQWFALWLQWNGTDTNVFFVRVVDDLILSFATTSLFDVRDTADVVLGGLASRRSRRKQSQCISGQYGPVVIGAAGGSVGTAYLSADIKESATVRLNNLTGFIGLARTTIGTRNRDVAITSTSGRTVFDCLSELCRSAGSTIVASRTVDDQLVQLLPDQLRSSTVAVTLDASNDLDGGRGITWSKGSGFSSVTATYPGGSVTYTDPDRPERGTTIEVAALSESHALECASAIVNTARRLRIERLEVDIAGATNDLWSAFMSLEVGARIRVTLGTATSLLARHYGRTYVDVYVLGWTEYYGEGLARWVLDTIAADDPVAGRFDDTVRGRFAARPGTITVTSGTAVGTTATGTIVATTDVGQPALTVAAGAYPMTLDWGGELVTVTSPPASSTSPQTLTITARGVDGSIARVHATGEPLQVAYPAAHTF